MDLVVLGGAVPLEADEWKPDGISGVVLTREGYKGFSKCICLAREVRLSNERSRIFYQRDDLRFSRFKADQDLGGEV